MRKSNYDKQPATPVEGCIWQGWQAIRSELQQACQQDGTKVLVIECYQGVYHDEIRQGLSGLGAHWIESQSAFKSVEEIEKMTFPYVTDDRLFGFRAHFSYEDFFDTEKAARKKFMSIKTDSKGMEEPKDPDTCSVFQLYKLFASPEQVEEMRARYLAGNYGYGHAKQALFEAYMEFFAPMRKRREELLADPGYVHSVLKAGAEKARAEAVKTMKTVRERVGLA